MNEAELKIAEEKLGLERERLSLDRERLAAEQERFSAEKTARLRIEEGRLSVSLANFILTAVVCLLLGAILGGAGVSLTQERRERARLRDVMDSIAASDDVLSDIVTNPAPQNAVRGGLARALRPEGAHQNVSLFVIRGPDSPPPAVPGPKRGRTGEAGRK
ncbi:MAG: hypothetical protein J5985_08030 [Kiritimatiellae bacterium]|nr:hypothetical protein [Kiritimatiellia bacterium]